MASRICIGVFILLAAPAGIASAQGTAPAWPEPKLSDNSFLVEEAYNQEPGVAQHIATFTRTGVGPRDYAFGFTQEWPLLGKAHQISYTLPYAFLAGNTSRGVGDVMIHYRYQVPGMGERSALAPRMSLILPSGDSNAGFGGGGAGVQVNLAYSVRLTPAVTAHLNSGATVMPRLSAVTSAGDTVHRAVTTYSVAGSIVAPVSMPVNALLEYVVNAAGSIREDGTVVRETETILNPGVRAAFEFAGAQVVPGFSVGINPRHPGAPKMLLFYFSVERAFRPVEGR
jgi:hypothetical protein